MEKVKYGKFSFLKRPPLPNGPFNVQRAILTTYYAKNSKCSKTFMGGYWIIRKSYGPCFRDIQVTIDPQEFVMQYLSMTHNTGFFEAEPGVYINMNTVTKFTVEVVDQLVANAEIKIAY